MVVCKPFLGLFAGMLWIIILLKNNVSSSFTIVLQTGLKILLQNLDIEIPIHPSINLDSISWPIPCHTAPNHHRNFNIPSTSLLLSPSPAFFQAHFLPSDPSLLNFVSSDHTTLFQSSTVQCW